MHEKHTPAESPTFFCDQRNTENVMLFEVLDIKHSLLIIKPNQTQVFLTVCVKCVHPIKEIINVVPQVISSCFSPREYNFTSLQCVCGKNCL